MLRYTVYVRSKCEKAKRLERLENEEDGDTPEEQNRMPNKPLQKAAPKQKSKSYLLLLNDAMYISFRLTFYIYAYRYYYKKYYILHYSIPKKL